MAGEGVINGFTEKMKEVFTGGYYTLNPGHPDFNNELLKMTLAHKPDIIFLQIQTPDVLMIETAKEIAKHSFVMEFSGDIRLASPPQHYIDIGRHIHLSTFSNMKDVIGCREQGVTADWLEIGYDPEKYKTWDNIPVEYDIVAHFNDYGTDGFPLSQYRHEIVSRLRSEFGDKFQVFGKFPGAKDNFNHDQVEESKNYNRAKIAINCSHFCAEKYSSDRLLRILGSGTACVSHHFPGINEMYTLGSHFYSFNTLDSMVELCSGLLIHDDARKKVAAAGQKHVQENYTFWHMAQNIKKLYLKYNGKI